MFKNLNFFFIYLFVCLFVVSALYGFYNNAAAALLYIYTCIMICISTQTGSNLLYLFYVPPLSPTPRIHAYVREVNCKCYDHHRSPPSPSYSIMYTCVYLYYVYILYVYIYFMCNILRKK